MRLLLAPLLLLSSMFSALADDIPQLNGTVDVDPKSDDLWSGFYAGVTIGGSAGDAWLRASPSSEVFAFFPPLSASDAASLNHSMRHGSGSMLGGIHLGYSQPMGGVLLGAEADFSFANLSDRTHSQSTITTIYAAGFPPRAEPVEAPFVYTTDMRQDVDWTASGRVRLGVTPADRLMAYGTAGVAFGGTRSSLTAELVPAGALLPQEVLARYRWDGSHVLVGGAVGAGLEYALTERLRIRAEYLHIRLGGSERVRPNTSDRFIYPVPAPGVSGSATNDVGYPPPLHPDASLRIREQTRFNIFRIGLSYRF